MLPGLRFRGSVWYISQSTSKVAESPFMLIAIRCHLRNVYKGKRVLLVVIVFNSLTVTSAQSVNRLHQMRSVTYFFRPSNKKVFPSNVYFWRGNISTVNYGIHYNLLDKGLIDMQNPSLWNCILTPVFNNNQYWCWY